MLTMEERASTPASEIPARDVVLFVDDQPEILASLRRLLRDEPFEVATTTSARDALRRVCRGGVSVVVTDERMPGVRGSDLLERIGRRSPETLRVVLTAYPGSYTLQYGLSHGVDWLISKPWNDEALKLTLRQLLQRRGRSATPAPERPRPLPFEELCADAPGAMMVVDVRGRVRWANAALAELIGAGREELAGRPLAELTAAPEAAAELLGLLAERGGIRGRAVRLRTKDGQAFDAHLDAGPIRGELALVQARPAVPGEGEARFRLLVESVKDYALYMLDPEGRVCSWNVGAERIHGFRSDEILGKHFSCFYTAEDVEAGKPERLLRAAEADGRAEDEGPRVRKDGGILWANAVITAVRDPEGRLRGFSKVTRDVTERRRSEEERRRLEQQILQGQKLQAIGRLSAGIAHEINTPVGYILSNLATMQEYVADLVRLVRAGGRAAERLQAGAPPAEGVAELEALRREVDFDFIVEDFASAARDSRQGAERIRDIVKNLREFLHIDEGEVKPVDLNACLESALRICWNDLKYKAEIERDFAPLPPVPCPPQRMEQVFVNLLVNAGQAIAKKGVIRLSTRVEGDQAVVAVEDTGVGMSAEVLRRLFEPFFTTKPVGAGMGLGLDVAYRIVRSLGGHIEVVSEPGKGTRFTIRVPLAGAAPAERKEG
jgi:two-component system NtrC family sensor kinase